MHLHKRTTKMNVTQGQMYNGKENRKCMHTKMHFVLTSKRTVSQVGVTDHDGFYDDVDVVLWRDVHLLHQSLLYFTKVQIPPSCL